MNFENIDIGYLKSFEDFKMILYANGIIKDNTTKSEIEKIKEKYEPIRNSLYEQKRTEFILKYKKEPLSEYSNGVITEDGNFFPCGYMGHNLLVADLIDLGYGDAKIDKYWYYDQKWFILTNGCTLHGNMMYSILNFNNKRHNEYLKHLNVNMINTLFKYIENHPNFQLYGKGNLNVFLCNLYTIKEELENE